MRGKFSNSLCCERKNLQCDVRSTGGVQGRLEQLGDCQKLGRPEKKFVRLLPDVFSDPSQAHALNLMKPEKSERFPSLMKKLCGYADISESDEGRDNAAGRVRALTWSASAAGCPATALWPCLWAERCLENPRPRTMTAFFPSSRRDLVRWQQWLSWLIGFPRKTVSTLKPHRAAVRDFELHITSW